MSDIRPQTWVFAVVVLVVLLLLTAIAKAGVIADRYPEALVKVTATGRVLQSEGAWKGHVKRIGELTERPGVGWFLLEPFSPHNPRVAPALVPGTNQYVRQVILDGATVMGLWVGGRRVVAP
jgi:hypothetical protein